jgi:predicted patatin/cPLA2 family phospholipase
VVLSHRCQYYNEQLELVERLEDEGKILAIRPQRPMEVGRIERDTKKLTALYEEGYQEAEKMLTGK